MSYTPDSLAIVPWNTIFSISGGDRISDLDEEVTSVINGASRADSLLNWVNGELIKIPGYLDSEMVKIYNEAQSGATDSSYKARAWEMTANSYANEPHGTFVKLYTSNGDGTFSYTDTTDYSALHWSTESDLAGVPTPVFPADETLVLTAHQSGNKWEEVIGTPDETGKMHQTMTNDGVKKGSYWMPAVSSPETIPESFALQTGQQGILVSPTVPDGVDITIPDGSVMVIL